MIPSGFMINKAFMRPSKGVIPMRKILFAVLSAAAIAALPASPAAQTAIPKSGLPVLTTSAGQSNDANTVNAVLEEADTSTIIATFPRWR